MLLPIIDVGLMNEHLSTHEGLLGKLDLYLIESSATYLKKIITIQQTVFKSHIQVMLELLNPYFDVLTKQITLEKH